ncbi:MAG: chemotaxis protein CheW [Planctomycetes bacterium]|nr:chemotaxis protein CheW [Planctomycetota bacterium]
MVNIFVFKIGAACFGIETANVKAIAKNLEWVEDEPFPDFADGLADYDGRKLSVIDLERKFLTKTDKPFIGTLGNESQPESPFSKGRHKGIDVFSDKRINACREKEFIVVSFEGHGFVIPIDEVGDIVQVSEKDILPIPVFAVRHMSKNFFKGVFAIGDKLALILDIGKL